MYMETSKTWFYEDCFTLDPTKSLNAWEKLGADQAQLELNSLPAILQKSLIESIRESDLFCLKNQKVVVK